MEKSARKHHIRDAWILTQGHVGHENPCRGVMAALGVAATIKRVNPPAPWRWMSPWGPAATTPSVAPPWPDLLIASGRLSIPYARMIRRRSRGETFVAVLQSPHVSSSRFDLVWAPMHDRLRGRNVLETVLSPHHLTRAMLESEAAAWESQVAHLPSPRVAVLVGGPNQVYGMDGDVIDRLCDMLIRMARTRSASLMVTSSRRTGAENIRRLSARLSDTPAVIREAAAENPYAGFLGLADAVVVTGDSVNMVGEALFTGKPVHVFSLPGGSAKFERFHGELQRQGLTRPFEGRLESWSYAAPDATIAIAGEIRSRLEERPR